jgi:DNA-binding NarL/FixJ family response regulator
MRDVPSQLRVRVVDRSVPLLVVSFELDEIPLTGTELDVARRAAAGFSNDAIARSRGTSTRTVANQVSSILRKLSLGSRLELATVPELV